MKVVKFSNMEKHGLSTLNFSDRRLSKHIGKIDGHTNNAFKTVTRRDAKSHLYYVKDKIHSA